VPLPRSAVTESSPIIMAVLQLIELAFLAVDGHDYLKY